MPGVEAKVSKELSVKDVYYKVERASGAPTEYHKLINPTSEMVDGEIRVSGGKDVIISQEEYEANAE